MIATNEYFTWLYDSLLSEIKKIANASRAEVTVQELKAEIWIAVTEHTQSEPSGIELKSDEFQKQILRALWKKFGRFAEHAFKHAYRLDAEWENDDGRSGTNSIASSLRASKNSEPEHILLLREEADLMREKHPFTGRFAEAVAYVRVVERFHNDWLSTATFLAITPATLKSRFHRALRMVAVQPSLFDSLEYIPEDFSPLKGFRARPLPLPFDALYVLRLAFRRRQIRLFPGAPIPIRFICQCRTG